MVDKIYLNPNTAGVIRQEFDRVISELRALRRGHELYLWDEEVEKIDLDEEENGVS